MCNRIIILRGSFNAHFFSTAHRISTQIYRTQASVCLFFAVYFRCDGVVSTPLLIEVLTPPTNKMRWNAPRIVSLLSLTEAPGSMKQPFYGSKTSRNATSAQEPAAQRLLHSSHSKAEGARETEGTSYP